MSFANYDEVLERYDQMAKRFEAHAKSSWRNAILASHPKFKKKNRDLLGAQRTLMIAVLGALWGVSMGVLILPKLFTIF